MTNAVFWTALAIAFGGLAVFVYWERRQILENKIHYGGVVWMGELSPIARSLTTILIVELVGFVLAAIAAVYEGFG